MNSFWMYNKQNLAQNQLFNESEMFLEVLGGVVSHDFTLTLVLNTTLCRPATLLCLNPIWNVAAQIQDYNILWTSFLPKDSGLIMENKDFQYFLPSLLSTQHWISIFRGCPVLDWFDLQNCCLCFWLEFHKSFSGFWLETEFPTISAILFVPSGVLNTDSHGIKVLISS